MRRRTLGLLLVVTAAAGCGEKPAAAPRAAAPATVETAVVVSRKLATTDHLPAQLLPYESVDIYPKVTGFLEEIRVDVGSRVRAGELLMRLSAPELVSQRAQAEAALHAAESQLTAARAKLASDQGTFQRLQAASKTPGVVAGNDLMVASQTVEADRAGVDTAEHNVTAAGDVVRGVAQMQSYLNITAPFSGVVSRRNLHPGALVGPASGPSGAQPILQIVDTDRLRLVVPVPETDVGAMSLGQRVAFSVAAYPGQTFDAPLARVSHDVDVQTRTMRVELDVQNQDGKFAPGSFVTVTWPVARSYATLFVPASAVTSDQQRTFVIRVSDGTAEWVPVQTGKTVDGEIEVFGALRAGDEVVRSASDAIRNGQKLAVARAPAADGGAAAGRGR